MFPRFHPPVAVPLVLATLTLLRPASHPAAAQEARDWSRPLEPVEAALPGGGTLAGERGRLEVPLVRGGAAGSTVEIEVTRFPAGEGADPGTPPVFFLNGGPGWPGTAQMLRQPAAGARIERFTREADLVFVGQRGIGTSAPNTVCLPPEGPAEGDVVTPELRARAIRAAVERCRARWEDRGYDLAGFNVLEAAADVDDVRRALGYDRISLYGGSFGSHWAMAVLRTRPDIVARAVLRGLEGPDHTYDRPSGVVAALRRIDLAAREDPRLAPRIPEEGLVEAFRGLAERLDREPEVLTRSGGTPLRLSGDDLRGSALGYTSSTSSRGGARTWPSDVIRLLEGDFAGLAGEVAEDRTSFGYLPSASALALDCGSGITLERREAYRAEKDAQAVVGDPGWFYDAACPALDVDLGDDFRTRFRFEVPALLVHGTWDTSTPYPNALELLPAFPQGHLVTVEGGSHGALEEAMEAFPGFADRVFRFLETGDLEGMPERLVLPPLDFEPPPPRRRPGGGSAP